MKNIKLGYALSFYMHRKILLYKKKIKKILGISKAIGVIVSPLLCIWQFECSVHIFRGPCPSAQQSSASILSGKGPELQHSVSIATVQTFMSLKMQSAPLLKGS